MRNPLGVAIIEGEAHSRESEALVGAAVREFRMGRRSRQQQSDTATAERVRVEKPKMYRVILLNDDFTSMEFVVVILELIFHKSPAEATQIMLQVHKAGRGVAGIFSKQIAEAKIDQVHRQARNEGFPLRCVMEEA